MQPLRSTSQPAASSTDVDVHPSSILTNEEVADLLDEIALLLEHEDANAFRIRAYARAAETVRSLEEPIGEILRREGVEGLEMLPAIGDALARLIEQLVRTGHVGLLDTLRSKASPTEVLMSVPGIGPVLARRIEDQLGITSLHDLEAAAHDGRLGQVPGIGPGRVLAVRQSLAGRLASTTYTHAELARAEPDVALLLDIDREYRERAPNDLPRIAPHRFNPTSEAWLPVLHTRRDDNRFTAMFSNTERAHALDKTDDWVVIYRDGRVRDPASNRWTVVTETQGPLAGARVVRGREDECAAMLDAEASPGRSGSEANAAQNTGARADRDAIRG